MTTLEEKRQRRLLLMRRLYEVTDGDYLAEVPPGHLAEDLGWTHEEIEPVLAYLKHERLIESTNQAGHLAIRHEGVIEVEEALAHPSKSTRHFAAANLVIEGDVTGSQIQVGTVRSSQKQGRVSITDQRPAIDAFVDAFRAVLDDTNVPQDQRAQVAADIATIDAQLAAPEPSDAIVRESLGSLRSIAENLVASGLWVGLLELAQHIHL